jgi:diguanylate cyclase (GGDEF)-like protein
MLLAWRFHSSRIFLSLLVLFIAQQAATLSAGSPPFIPSTFTALAVLVPIDFVLIAVMQERGFIVQSVAPFVLFLFVQSLTVAVFCGVALRVPRLQVLIVVPRYAIGVLVSAGIYLCVRFLLNRKPVDSALLWSLGTFFLALRYAPAALKSMAYWVSSACILGTAVIENSYLLAYYDELTTLPSRRAFNDALLGLRYPYSIAVVDIDHFKRFNDTYGHDTGDEVLRMVAANLARVTGGGEAYRCGGEEFNILFPGKVTTEVLPHLEKLREDVEKAEFRLRGNERRQTPRGPDRRHKRNRSRARKQEATDAESNLQAGLSVTISIGVSTATTDESRPEAVIKSADKALYRAKENGRNRVEMANYSPRRLRTKAAGIA